MTRKRDALTESTELVFVYGSLKAGFPLHNILEGYEFVGQYKTQPSFKLMNLGPFPALVHADEGGVRVSGEVYKIDPDVLNYLDVVEGVHRGLYARELIVVHDQLGNQITPWAYVARRSAQYAREEIKSGVWV